VLLVLDDIKLNIMKKPKEAIWPKQLGPQKKSFLFSNYIPWLLVWVDRGHEMKHGSFSSKLNHNFCEKWWLNIG
jgi:hypothetical protein